MAKKFAFTLEPVLRYREMIENEKKRDFAVANRAVDEERLRLRDLNGWRGETQEEVVSMYAEESPFIHVIEAYRYINTLDLQISHGLRRLDKLQATAEEKRQALMESQQQRRALEILRERRCAEYNYQAARAEQAGMDELAIQAKRRRDSEGG